MVQVRSAAFQGLPVVLISWRSAQILALVGRAFGSMRDIYLLFDIESMAAMIRSPRSSWKSAMATCPTR